MGVGEWISLCAFVLAVFGVCFAGWNSLRNEIRDSRHKTMGDLQPKLAAIDEDIGELRKDVNGLAQRVAALEARRSRGAN